MRVNLKGLYWAKAKGKVYWYAWKGGPRLTGEPGSPEFMAGYHSAIEARKAGPTGTFAGVIATYKASGEFDKLAPRTKRDYLKHIKAIELEFGKFPTRFFTAQVRQKLAGQFLEWRDGLAKKSLRQADYAWSILGRICSVGVRRGKIEINPCEKGGRLYESDRNDSLWTLEDEALFMERAPVHLRLPLLLALWTGQRQGDLLALTWPQYDGKYIRLRQGKSGKRVTIPVGKPLKALLDANRGKVGPVLLTTEGTPWTEDGFRSSWFKACKKVGITAGLTFHDIRGSAVTRLALAGGSVPEIATITGHSLRDVESILDAHYLSRDVTLAESGIAKLERGRE